MVYKLNIIIALFKTVMSFMINDVENRNWRTYFDYVLVDARKPLFFEEGTALKEINIVIIFLFYLIQSKITDCHLKKKI